MKRSAPMKRTAMKSPVPAPRPAKTFEVHTPRQRLVAVASASANAPVFNPQPKVEAIQHAGYMKIVRTFACARCGWYRKGGIQFAHADVLGIGGKGIGLKSDCRLGWPGCGPHDGLPGCHYIVGSTGKLGKQGRRDFEAAASARTRARAIAIGKWPARLPLWVEASLCPTTAQHLLHSP